jgi:hypothetical protein
LHSHAGPPQERDLTGRQARPRGCLYRPYLECFLDQKRILLENRKNHFEFSANGPATGLSLPSVSPCFVLVIFGEGKPMTFFEFVCF